MSKEFECWVWRQSGASLPGGWEVLSLSFDEKDTVLDALRRYNQSKGARAIRFCGEDDEAARGPMNINGVPALAGETTVADLAQPVMLSPFESFSLVADLAVDLSPLQSDLKAAAKLAPESVNADAIAADCGACGVCHEAASEYRVGEDGKTGYMGPAPIMILEASNGDAAGAEKKSERMALLMGERGVIHDRNTFTYDGVCPVERDLVGAMARAKRQTTFRWLAGLGLD